MRNTGSEEADVQLTSVDTYGDAATNGVSDAVSLYPHDHYHDHVTLTPGESIDVEFEYSSDFHPFDPFNWHYMSTTLWMQGTVVDQVEDAYYITPSLDLLPLSATDEDVLQPAEMVSDAEFLAESIATDDYLLTDASKASGEVLTVEDWAEYVGDIERIIQDDIEPDRPTTTVDYEVSSDSRGVTFMLGSPPDVELNLSVIDESGRRVGYDPDHNEDVVEIPDAEYNGHESTLEIISIDEATGSYQVEAEGVRFFTTETRSASIYAVEIPERDSVLGVSPTTATTLIEPGSTGTATIQVSETGNQVDMEVVDVTLGDFEATDGTPLSGVDVSISRENFSVAAGETESIELSFTADETIDLPNDETRFTSELLVETESTGIAILEVSVLIFDTEVEDAQLADANRGVDGVSMTEAEPPADPPDGLTIDRAYQIDTVGSGSLSISLPREAIPIEEVTVYLLEGETWTELDRSSGDRAAVELSAPTTATLVVGASDPSPLGRYTNSDGVVENEGLNTAVQDYLDPDVALSDEQLNAIVQSYLSGEPVSV